MSKKSAADAKVSAPDTKERILKIAAELFADRGYHATGMAELESATNLGRGALYYHIGNKEELLFEITSRYLHLLIAEGEPICGSTMPAEAKFREFSRIVMRTIVEHLAELTVCFREVHSVVGARQDELMALHRRYERIWATILEAGVAEGLLRTSDPLAVKVILSTHHYSYLWIKPGGKLSPDQISTYFCDVLLPGLKARSTDD